MKIGNIVITSYENYSNLQYDISRMNKINKELTKELEQAETSALDLQNRIAELEYQIETLNKMNGK